MARELRPIDVSRIPELLRIAEEVYSSGEGRVLRREDEALAIVLPARRPANRGSHREKTKEDLEAFAAAAGGWSDVDTDKLVADIYESRRSSRPPLEL
jgi:hypothetical protein